MQRKFVFNLFLLVSAVFFALFFFLPVFQVLRGGITDSEGRFTFFYLAEIFRNPLYRNGLWNSLLIACCTTLLSLSLALPLAWLADRYDFSGKRLLTAALLLPMILAPFVGALGMQCIFGRYGAFNMLLLRLGIISSGQEPDWFAGGFAAIVLLEALHLFPILYLNIVAALANIDPALLEASADYGCVGFQRFRRITLPLVMPGIFAGSTLVFIWSFTELGTPLMLNYGRTTAVQIFSGLNELGNNPMPYALVTVLMLLSGLAYVLAKFWFGRKSFAMSNKAGHSVSALPLQGWKNVLVVLCFTSIGLFSILPHLGVLGMAFGQNWYRSILPTSLGWQNFQAALGHSLTIPSIINSMRYASFALLLALALGTFAAYVIVRGKGKWGWLLDGCMMLPLAVPGIVLAFGYLALSQKGHLFHCLDPVRNPTILLVIAYAVRRLPYIVRSAVAGLQQTSISFEEAAASLGAGPLTSFRRITVPLIAANLIAGSILTFSFSMLEVSDSLILAHKAAYFPITKAIYELSSLLGQGQALASALGLWTMAFLGLSMLAASCLLGKRMGAIFRA
ncbi:MAG: iron ABC transporter permease [Lentisphaeria bacterium]